MSWRNDKNCALATDSSGKSGGKREGLKNIEGDAKITYEYRDRVIYVAIRNPFCG